MALQDRKARNEVHRVVFSSSTEIVTVGHWFSFLGDEDTFVQQFEPVEAEA